MGLDIYFIENVAHILAALSSAGEQRGPEYQQALADVGLAFGLYPADTTRAELLTQQKALSADRQVWPIQVMVPEEGGL